MELKIEYKKTDLGWLPNNWEVRTLGSCLVSPPSYGINAPAVPYVDSLPAYVRITDITDDGRFLPQPLVSVDSPFSARYQLKENDIVLARTGASVGKSWRYDTNFGPLVFAGFLIKVSPDSTRLLPDFAAAYLLTATYWRWVKTNSMRSGQPGINGGEFSRLPLPVPPVEEQYAIIRTLFAVDSLIAGLEKLIAKKCDLKQAAMQQLLTGQTRLPGFSGEWSRNDLKNLVSTPITDGPHLTPTFYETGVPFLSVNNLANNRIDWSDLRFISKADDEIFSRKCKPRKGDVLLGKAASVGKVAIVEDDFDFNIWSPIALIRSNAQVDAKFLYYQLLSADCITQVMLLTNSSSQGNIGMGDIEKIQISYPDLDEQNAIAKALSDIDAELTVLESRITKTRDLKQGIMQELLTGRTRLV